MVRAWQNHLAQIIRIMASVPTYHVGRREQPLTFPAMWRAYRNA
ncbi:hypothetical protein [Acidithiobacillus ferridurans]|nr:hypothetical protein [Acidithiobacillus ferridurans]